MTRNRKEHDHEEAGKPQQAEAAGGPGEGTPGEEGGAVRQEELTQPGGEAAVQPLIVEAGPDAEAEAGPDAYVDPLLAAIATSTTGKISVAPAANGRPERVTISAGAVNPRLITGGEFGRYVVVETSRGRWVEKYLGPHVGFA